MTTEVSKTGPCFGGQLDTVLERNPWRTSLRDSETAAAQRRAKKAADDLVAVRELFATRAEQAVADLAATRWQPCAGVLRGESRNFACRWGRPPTRVVVGNAVTHP